MKKQKLHISKISLNEDNPRFIRDEKYKKLLKSIQEFPEMYEVRPIVVNTDLQVLGGNMRFRAMQEAGFTEINVVVVDWDNVKQREFIIKDNLGYGEWDFEKLANEWDLQDLTDWGMDLPDLDLPDDEDDEDDEDVKNDESEFCNILHGDLFTFDGHRVLCGDSEIANNVEKLLNGENPYICITDPPYGVKYEPEWRAEASKIIDGKDSKNYSGRSKNKIPNDEKASWHLAYALSPAKVFYIWHASSKSYDVLGDLQKCNIELRAQIIWNKSQSVISRGHYHFKHEPCFYGVVKDCKANWIGDRKNHTVWDIDKARVNNTGFSTQKPVETFTRALKNHEGDLHDPFLGSGTALIACKNLQRKCYAMEDDPKHVQISVKRYLRKYPDVKVYRNGEDDTEYFQNLILQEDEKELQKQVL